MTVSNSGDNWRKEWHETTPEERQFYFPIVLVGIGLIVGLLLGLILFASPTDRTSYGINVYTSVLSTLVTIGVIDRLNERRLQAQLKAQLIREMGSFDNSTSLRAVNEMKARGWGFGNDNSLRGAILHQANLRGAEFFTSGFVFGRFAGRESFYTDSSQQFGVNLEKARLLLADLEGANMLDANLQGAVLYSTKLTNARLHRANLRKAHLGDADLQGSDLSDANLQEAVLGRANLQRACLTGANLRKANLYQADLREAYWKDGCAPSFDENTTLPDGSKWTSNSDISRFTKAINVPISLITNKQEAKSGS